MTVIPNQEQGVENDEPPHRRRKPDAAKVVLICAGVITACAGATEAVVELIRYLLGG